MTPSGAQRPADLAALTMRDDFLLELGEVLGGRAGVHPADSLDAGGHLRLVVDRQEVGGNIEDFAEILGILGKGSEPGHRDPLIRPYIGFQRSHQIQLRDANLDHIDIQGFAYQLGRAASAHNDGIFSDGFTG